MGGFSNSGIVQRIIPGTNVTVGGTATEPVVNSTGGGGGATNVIGGQDIVVDNTDPANPIVGTSIAISELAPVAAKYFRFGILATQSGSPRNVISEIRFYLGGTQLDVSGAVASSNGDFDALRVVSSILEYTGTSYWRNDTALNPTPTAWVSVEFPQQVDVSSVGIKSASDGTLLNYMPIEILVQISNDGLVWNDLVTLTTTPDWTVSELRSFPLPSNVLVPRFPLEAPKDGNLYARRDGEWVAI